MRTLASWLLLFALLGHVAAHITIAMGFAQKGRYARAALALLVPPLAPVWGWEDGMRLRVVAWCVTLGTYALGVVFFASAALAL